MRILPLILLIVLRHKLFWAKARSRNAKITLASGLLLIGFFALLLAMGGAGVGALATRFANPVLVADFAFAMIFLSGLSASLIFGLDSNWALSEQSLRRYPLARIERLTARYAAGLFDPVWLLVFVLDFSIAAGFAVAGASPWWVAVPAAILLFATNYLAARLLVEIVARIMAMRGGPVVLTLVLMLIFALPGLVAPTMRTSIGPGMRVFLGTLRFSPPLAVASVVAGTSAVASLVALFVVLFWLLAFAAALVALEGRPIRSTALAGAEATWNSPYDFFAAMFGPTLAPLAGKTLRYYVRSPMFALNCLICAICPTFFALTMSRGERDPMDPFLTALVMVIPFVAFGSAGPVASDIFGFDRSGFRRYFFSPLSSRSTLQAIAFVPLLLEAALVPVSLGVFLLFWHGVVDSRMVILWLSFGFGGLLLFQGLGLWTSLFSPRARDFQIRYGKTLPLAQNLLMIAALMAWPVLNFVFLKAGSRDVLAYWWVAAVLLIPTTAFYLFTLHQGARVFRRRREWMLSILERNP